MAATLTINDVYKGEPVAIDLLAKDPDGSVISSPASQEIYLTISQTAGGSPTETFTTVSGQVTLADAGTGLFEIRLSASDVSGLTEGQKYYLNIWSELSGVRRVQAVGTITLLASIEPV